MNSAVIRVLFVGGSEAAFAEGRALLQEEGGTVFEAAWEPHFEIARERLRANAFDVALVGADFCGNRDFSHAAALRSAGCSVPLVVLTATDDRSLNEQSRSLGATVYFLKNDRGLETLPDAVRQAAFSRSGDSARYDERGLLRSVIETIPDRIYVKDVTGRYVIDNAAHRKFIGVEGPEDVLGKTAYDFFDHEIAAKFDAGDKALLRSGEPVHEREEMAMDEHGREIWMLTSKVPLRGEAGQMIGVLGVSRDITERKRAEVERECNDRALREALAELQASHEELKATQLLLIQTEKMESMGRLAAGVSHEVKNPLAQIMLAADFLRDSVPADNPDLQAVLGDIREAVIRADKVVQGMQDFSAPGEFCFRRHDINETVRQALVLLKPEMVVSHIEVRPVFGDGLPAIEFDENKLSQVFVSLCTNAVQAMPKGGVLSIKTSLDNLAESAPREGGKAKDRLRAGDHVLVAEFADTGHGIPPDKLGSVFDPFFTTRPTGKGTGLGLTVARKIVELHGGRLVVENIPSGGVRASVILPIKNIESAPPAKLPAL